MKTYSASLLIALFSISAPLIAAGNSGQLDRPQPVITHQSETCGDSLCVETNIRPHEPGLFDKPNVFEHRQRTDPRSTSDYDNTDASVRLKIGF